MIIILLSTLNLILLTLVCFLYLHAKKLEESTKYWKSSYDSLASRYRKSRDEYWELNRANALKGRQLLELESRK